MKKYKVVNREDHIWPFENEYSAENEIGALKQFVDESKQAVRDLKYVKFSFELSEPEKLVKEFTDGEPDGVEFIALEV